MGFCSAEVIHFPNDCGCKPIKTGSSLITVRYSNELFISLWCALRVCEKKRGSAGGGDNSLFSLLSLPSMNHCHRHHFILASSTCLEGTSSLATLRTCARPFGCARSHKHVGVVTSPPEQMAEGDLGDYPIQRQAKRSVRGSASRVANTVVCVLRRRK